MDDAAAIPTMSEMALKDYGARVTRAREDLVCLERELELRQESMLLRARMKWVQGELSKLRVSMDD